MVLRFSRRLFRTAIICFLSLLASQGVLGGTAEVLKTATSNLIEDFKGSRLNDRTQFGLNQIIEKAIKGLRDRQLNEIADRYQREWNQNFSNYFLKWQLLDLGDHRPLFQWLADFHAALETHLGKEVCNAFNLDDLRILNYAIPVVFNPKGVKDDRWDKVEYRKHFVPLTSIILIWRLKSVCDSNFTGLSKKFCHTVVQIPRVGYEKWIAPILSDYVYDVNHNLQMASFDNKTGLAQSQLNNSELMRPLEVLWPLTKE